MKIPLTDMLQQLAEDGRGYNKRLCVEASPDSHSIRVAVTASVERDGSKAFGAHSDIELPVLESYRNTDSALLSLLGLVIQELNVNFQ